MLVVYIAIALVLYVIAGLIMAYYLMDLRQTNPVQDRIYWTNRPTVVMLWPLLLPAWLLSGLLSRVFWPDYVSHRDRMEGMINEVIREIDYDNPHAGTIEYRIPSPRAFRECGLQAASITVYED